MSTLNTAPVGQREFSIGTVLSQTFSAFIRNFPSFALAALVIYAPYFIYYFFFAEAPPAVLLDEDDFVGDFLTG